MQFLHFSLVHDQVVLDKMYILFSYMRLYIGLDFG